jgi:hypothetical protein
MVISISIKKASGVRVVEEGCSEMSKVKRSWVDDDVKQVQNCWDPSLSVRGGRPVTAFAHCVALVTSIACRHRIYLGCRAMAGYYTQSSRSNVEYIRTQVSTPENLYTRSDGAASEHNMVSKVSLFFDPSGMVELVAIVIVFDKNREHHKHRRRSPLGIRHLDHIDCRPVFRSLFTPVSMPREDANRTREQLYLQPSASHLLPPPPDLTCIRSSEKPAIDKGARFLSTFVTAFNTTNSRIPMDIDEANIGGMPPPSSRTAACTNYPHENGTIPAYMFGRSPSREHRERALPILHGRSAQLSPRPEIS